MPASFSYISRESRLFFLEKTKEKTDNKIKELSFEIQEMKTNSNIECNASESHDKERDLSNYIDERFGSYWSNALLTRHPRLFFPFFFTH
jgi:hypothetical protein